MKTNDEGEEGNVSFISPDGNKFASQLNTDTSSPKVNLNENSIFNEQMIFNPIR